MITGKQQEECFTDPEEHECIDAIIASQLPKIRSFVYRIVMNDVDADDVTQEVFLRALKSISQFRRDAKISTWLHRIAVNTTYSFIAKKHKVIYKSHEKLSENVCKTHLEKDLQREELRAKITDALQSLSPKLRSAITLTTIHGIEIIKVAEMERCSEATVYWRVHQARKILKQRLDG